MMGASCSGQREATKVWSCDISRGDQAHRQGHWSRESASCGGSTLKSKAWENLGSHDGMEPESAKSDHQNPVSLGVNVNQEAALGLLSDFWTGSTLDSTEADQILETFFSQSFSQGFR